MLSITVEANGKITATDAGIAVVQAQVDGVTHNIYVRVK